MKKENMRKFAVRPHLESGLSYCSKVVFFSFAPWQKKKKEKSSLLTTVIKARRLRRIKV